MSNQAWRRDSGPQFDAKQKRTREREKLRTLPADAPDDQRARLRLLVGKDELRLGNNYKAVEHLPAASN